MLMPHFARNFAGKGDLLLCAKFHKVAGRPYNRSVGGFVSRSPSEQPHDDRRDGRKPDDQSALGMYRLVGIGFEFASTVGVMALLGWYLDKRWQTTPWLLVTGIAIGFAAGLWNLIRSAWPTFKN
jgi:F0F1-type ATP synthase assembly protein I